MGFRNNDDERMVRFPTMGEIAAMGSLKYVKQERTRLRTELAFRMSDRGGPDHKIEITLLRELIIALGIRIDQLEVI